MKFNANLPVNKYLLYFLVLVYVSGSIGFIIIPSFFLPFTPYTLVFTCFVFLIFQPINNLGFLLGFIGIALIGFLSEVLGVKTGLVFGNYHYGRGLGIKLLQVPIVISLNWGLMVSALIIVCNSYINNKWAVAIATSILAVMLDYLMEQVAPTLHFWYFKNGLAGLHNYVGWFILTFVSAILFGDKLKKGDSWISFIVLGLLILFFGLIFLAQRFT